MTTPYIPKPWDETDWDTFGIETKINMLRNASKTEGNINNLKAIKAEIESLIEIKRQVQYLTHTPKGA